VKNRKALSKSLTYHSILIIGASFLLIPLFWMVSTSLKTPAQVFAIPIQWIPDEIHWENFILPFKQQPNLPRYFFNSVLVTTSITISTLFLSSLAGYSLAKFRWPGRNLVFVFILATMMIPYQLLMIPYFLICKQFGLLNSYLGLIVPYLISAFGVFLMRQYILTIPNELLEAARIDGCSEFGIFLKIVLPLSKPAFFALGIFTFMLQWDNFLWPLIVISKDKYLTLPLAIMRFQGEYLAQYNIMMAISIIVMLPVFIVFLVAQRKFIEGMVLSGLKH